MTYREKEFWDLVDEIAEGEGALTVADLMLLKEAMASTRLDKGNGGTYAV